MYNIDGMPWGKVELEPEVEDWMRRLSDSDFGQAAFYVDLLAEQGSLLSEPYSRQLHGKLRELRFFVGRQQTRVTYYIATGRRIILLTVFRKTKQIERREIARAVKALEKCIAEGHTTED